VESAAIRHYNKNGKFDGYSRLGFKSYDQGREAFQGTEQDIIWLDEEAPESVRGECILRLMTTQGLLMETFTPLKGMTPVVMKYLPEGYKTDMAEAIADDKALIMAGWDDVPHLTEADKKRMMDETAPHLKDARSKGIPSLGAGAIYPVPESDFVVDDMPILPHWRSAYALDVGWNRTAAIWGATDTSTGITYLYSEHYRGEAEPAIHAASIRARGIWIPGCIDPAARGRSQKDGENLMQNYVDLGLELVKADNEVESGIYDVWTGLSTGTLKVFKSLQKWLMEYRMYRRDDKGRIVKVNDHLMDATRYLRTTGMKHAITQPVGQSFTIPSYGVLDQVVGL
jgi:phage terminase large subunit-like protein